MRYSGKTVVMAEWYVEQRLHWCQVNVRGHTLWYAPTGQMMLHIKHILGRMYFPDDLVEFLNEHYPDWVLR